ncbi:MAG TPA: hypothetical protein VK773_08995 [Acidimicrobiales bacterium]|nr:hypothetical protein [Acidimicrobiales bacterium]
MTLFILSVPLMALAVAAAVIPLLVVSHREHRKHRAELAVADPNVAPRAGTTPRVIGAVETTDAREVANPLAA